MSEEQFSKKAAVLWGSISRESREKIRLVPPCKLHVCLRKDCTLQLNKLLLSETVRTAKPQFE
jgi:hypothetical protein